MSTSMQDKDLFFSKTWDYINRYLPTQNSNSPKTRIAYTDALTIFRRYVSNERKISISQFRFVDCTYDFVLDFREYLSNKGYAPKTINQRISAIKSYLRYAALRCVDLQQVYLNIRDVPEVEVPKKQPPIIEDNKTIAAFLSAPGVSKKGIRDKVILSILFDCAIRCAELIDLKKSDVVLDPNNPYLFIHGKGNKERTVPLNDKTVPLIKQYQQLFHTETEADCPFIYTEIKGQHGKMTERNVQRIVKKYADIVRKDHSEMPKVHPHMLRRTRATKWFRDGKPAEVIAEILGHASVTTTMQSYAFSSPEMLRKYVNEKTCDEDDTSQKKLWEGKEDELAAACGLR